MKKGNQRLRSKEQISLIQNVENLSKYIFRDNSFLLSKAKYKTKYGSGLKTLSTKQMFQRLPIAIAQVKESNTSKNLLNEVRQIIHSLHREKEVTKKYITIEWIKVIK